MLRYAVAAATALAMVSGAALATPVGPVQTTVKQSDQGTKMTKRFINHRGDMVTKRKLISGNGMIRSTTVRNSMTGERSTRTRVHPE